MKQEKTLIQDVFAEMEKENISTTNYEKSVLIVKDEQYDYYFCRAAIGKSYRAGMFAVASKLTKDKKVVPYIITSSHEEACDTIEEAITLTQAYRYQEIIAEKTTLAIEKEDGDTYAVLTINEELTLGQLLKESDIIPINTNIQLIALEDILMDGIMFSEKDAHKLIIKNIYFSKNKIKFSLINLPYENFDISLNF